MPYPHSLHIDRCLPDGLSLNPRQDRQLIEIILLYPELRHDIERDVTAIERSRKLEVQMITANDDYAIRREIDNALNEAVARMQAYLLLPSPFVRRIATDHAGAWEEKNIFIGLPHNWPPHLINALRDAVHNFIVHKVVTYFMVLHLPNDPYTTICAQQAERAYNDINAHLNARLGPTHIQPSFLG